jgi:hypothetical protein
MQSTIPNHESKVSHPIQLPRHASGRSTVKLIYRGNIYHRTLRPIEVSERVETDAPTVTLIYRGSTYERQLPTPQPYRQPRVLNWRWQQHIVR